MQGYQADLFQSEGTILLTWQNEAGYLFMLRATDFGDTETLLSMAEGVVPYEGPGVAWEMGWVPEGYEPMYRDEGAGAVQQVWVRDGTTLTWQYVTDPICPFETPEGEPEEIDLRGVTGWYWTAEEEPEESEGPTITVNGKEIQAEGSSVTVGGVTIITGGSPDMEETGTLIWTDPDTNTTFFLEGPWTALTCGTWLSVRRRRSRGSHLPRRERSRSPALPAVGSETVRLHRKRRDLCDF